MPETQLTVIRDDNPEIVRVRQQADSLSSDLKDVSEMKPSLLTMRAGAKLRERVDKYIAFVHGALDPGIAEAYDVWKSRTALRSTLLRVPLDNAFGKQHGLTEAGKIEKQLQLIPNRAIAESKNLIERKKQEERREQEEAQRKAQEAERAKEVEHLEETGNVEAAQDLQAAPLPPVAVPVAPPVMPEVSTTQRYLVEGIEVTSYKTLAQWIGEQTEEMAERFINRLKSSAAAYLNATAGAEIPGIKASKSSVVVDRRK
jgi:hypothetical protein